MPDYLGENPEVDEVLNQSFPLTGQRQLDCCKCVERRGESWAFGWIVKQRSNVQPEISVVLDISKWSVCSLREYLNAVLIHRWLVRLGSFVINGAYGSHWLGARSDVGDMKLKVGHGLRPCTVGTQAESRKAARQGQELSQQMACPVWPDLNGRDQKLLSTMRSGLKGSEGRANQGGHKAHGRAKWERGLCPAGLPQKSRVAAPSPA